MTQRTNSAQSSSLISDNAIRSVMRRELQRAINVEKTFSRDRLSQESGVSTDLIDAIISRDPNKHRRLKMDDVFSLASVLGTRAVNTLLSVIAYGAYPLDETGAPNLSEIIADGAEHFAIICRALADGVIEPHEEEGATDAADRLIDTVTPISSRRKRA